MLTDSFADKPLHVTFASVWNTSEAGVQTAGGRLSRLGAGVALLLELPEVGPLEERLLLQIAVGAASVSGEARDAAEAE